MVDEIGIIARHYAQLGALQEAASARNGVGAVWKCVAYALRCALFRVRRERNCLSVTDRYHNGNGDSMKVGGLHVE